MKKIDYNSVENFFSNVKYGEKVHQTSPNSFSFFEYPELVFFLKKSKRGNIIIGGEKYKISESLEYGNIGTKILMYEDRIKGWLLNFGRNILKDKNSDFLLLMICISYLEGNQQFRNGRPSKAKETQEILKKSLKRMLKVPNIKKHQKLFDLFTREIRHGLAHGGLVKKHCLTNRNLEYPFMIDEEGESIIVNPLSLFELVEIDFKIYLSSLKDPENRILRKNFEKCWRMLHE